MKVRYVGINAVGAVICESAQFVARGAVVEVDDVLGESLCLQDTTWERVKSKSTSSEEKS